MRSATKSFALTALLLATVLYGTVLGDNWRAAAEKVKITPERPMAMAGYGSRNHPATGLLNDLYAKVLVLEDAQQQRVAIITLDLVGISPDVAGPITEQLETRYKLPRANIAICCSHTHSGPVVGKNLRTLHYDLLDVAQQEQIDHYARVLQDKIVTLVGQAIEKLEPSVVSMGETEVGFAANRRNNPEAEASERRAAGKLVGPQDHSVPVLRVARLEDGEPIAVLFGYACHATVLSDYDWSGDYPGFAQSEIEARHPACVALFFAGCGADQNPLPRRRVELARQYGQELGRAVDALLESKLEPLAPQLATGFTTIPLKLSHIPTRQELEAEAGSADKYTAARARLYLAELDAGRSLPDEYPYPIQVWRLGDTLTFIALGGEVVVDYALRLKSEHGAEQTWVAGYANDVMAYIPSRRVLTEGGYEGGSAMVYYALPSPWQPTIENAIVEAVRGTLPRP